MTVRIINRSIFLTALLLCIPAGAATAQETIRGTQMTKDDLPNQISNNTPADANKVMENLGSILQALQGVTKLHLYQNGEHKGSSILANVMLLDTGYAALVWSEHGSDDVFLKGDDAKEIYYESNDCSGTAYIDKNVFKYNVHLGEKGYLLWFENPWSGNVGKTFVQTSHSPASGSTVLNSFRAPYEYFVEVCDPANPERDPDYGYCLYPYSYDFIPAGTCISGAEAGVPDGQSIELTQFMYGGEYFPFLENDASISGVTTAACTSDESEMCLPNAVLVSE